MPIRWVVLNEQGDPVGHVEAATRDAAASLAGGARVQSYLSWREDQGLKQAIARRLCGDLRDHQMERGAGRRGLDAWALSHLHTIASDFGVTLDPTTRPRRCGGGRRKWQRDSGPRVYRIE